VAGARVKDLSGVELKVRYRIAKHFEYLQSGSSGPYMDFVNPPVDIYARDAARRDQAPPDTPP